MPKLVRYILSDLLKVFSLSLMVFTLLLVIVGIVREAVDQSLPPAQVIWLIPYILPDALRFTIPVTLLLAGTTVYSRMSGSNEILAIKAVGISPLRILLPALAGAFLLSLGTVWLNDLAVSWGRRGVQKVIVDAVEEIAYSMLSAQRRYQAPNFAINIKRLEGRTLIRPVLSIEARGDSPAVTITADEAELRADHTENVLTVALLNPYFEVQGGAGKVSGPGWYEYPIPLGFASRGELNPNTPSTLPLGSIAGAIETHLRSIERERRKLAADAAYQMICGDFDRLVGPEWAAAERRLATEHNYLHRLYTEPHRRWSAGFSCLCFMWIGAPMAIWLRNRDFLTSFFLCFAPILIVYYPLLAWGINGAKDGTIPPYSVWGGNALLLLAGCFLLRKVTRY
jgi:lipopolysaccharide export system permease protein